MNDATLSRRYQVLVGIVIIVFVHVQKSVALAGVRREKRQAAGQSLSPRRPTVVADVVAWRRSDARPREPRVDIGHVGHGRRRGAGSRHARGDVDDATAVRAHVRAGGAARLVVIMRLIVEGGASSVLGETSGGGCGGGQRGRGGGGYIAVTLWTSTLPRCPQQHLTNL